MMRHPFPGLLGLLGLLAVAGCSREQPPPPQPAAVLTFAAQSGAGALVASYTGEIRARYESQLGFRVPGKILQRLVEVGTHVRRGQPLARLDPADSQLSTEAARAAVAAAEADQVQAKADLARYADLRERHFISESEFDRRRNSFSVAEARVRQARAQLDLARNQAQYTTLAADADGVITARMAEAGQVVAAGQPVLELARDGERELLVNLPEADLAGLRPGVAAQVSLWARPQVQLDGVVREISPSADTQTHTYPVRISLPKAGPEVQLGMTAGARLAGPGAAVVAVPMSALFQERGQPAVWVVDGATQTLALRPVKVAGYGGEMAALSDGLRPGERIVRAGVQKLHAGEKVRLLQDTAP